MCVWCGAVFCACVCVYVCLVCNVCGMVWCMCHVWCMCVCVYIVCMWVCILCVLCCICCVVHENHENVSWFLFIFFVCVELYSVPK